MNIAPGSKLGPYKILAPLGAGGMGEVYRARDPRVGRDIAINRRKGDVPLVYLLFLLFVRRPSNSVKALGIICCRL